MHLRTAHDYIFGHYFPFTRGRFVLFGRQLSISSSISILNASICFSCTLELESLKSMLWLMCWWFSPTLRLRSSACSLFCQRMNSQSLSSFLHVRRFFALRKTHSVSGVRLRRDFQSISDDRGKQMCLKRAPVSTVTFLCTRQKDFKS